MGMLYDTLGNKGCRVTGSWSTRGYNFEGSKALRGNDFVGLLLDEENQGEETESRIDHWLAKLDFT
jgi:flavodoxin I